MIYCCHLLEKVDVHLGLANPSKMLLFVGILKGHKVVIRRDLAQQKIRDSARIIGG